MDMQNRVGSKPGSGGMASFSETNAARRDRLRKLAMEVIDLSNDPYLLKNHLGTLECKLCLTLHSNEGSYLAHTQGKKHQTNLARRAAKEQQIQQETLSLQPKYTSKKVIVKIGRPGYKVVKIRRNNQNGLLFQIMFPEATVNPQHRFMSSFEQKLETPNKDYQYLLVAADPYETIAFKIESKDIDEEDFIAYWDPDVKQYTLQFLFK